MTTSIATSGNSRLIFKHCLPQVTPLLIANTVLMVALAIFAETAIAFLGLGDPQKISWGLLIENAFARQAISLDSSDDDDDEARKRDGEEARSKASLP